MDYYSQSLAIALVLGALAVCRLLMRYAASANGVIGFSTPAWRLDHMDQPGAAHTGTNPHRFLRQVLAPFRFQARQRGLTLTSQLSDLPTALRGDFDGLEKCLRYAVSSALGKTMHGGVAVQVEVVPPASGRRVMLRFSVSDTSEGMASRELQTLLRSEPGWRAVVRWAHRTGGYVWAESRPGTGTITCFTTSMENVSPVADESAALRRLHVLVADENLVSRKLTIRALERAGHRADVAVNGLQALHKAIHSGYDAILMDLHMPLMDGSEVVCRLRQAESADGRHTPVIGLTPPSAGEQRIDALQAGLDDFLSKPVDSELLLEKLAIL